MGAFKCKITPKKITKENCEIELTSERCAMGNAMIRRGSFQRDILPIFLFGIYIAIPLLIIMRKMKPGYRFNK